MMNRTIQFTPLLLLLLTLLLAGCSYNGKVVAGQAVAPPEGKQSPHVLMIDGTAIAGRQVNIKPDDVSLTVEYGDALLDSLQRNLQAVYKEVFVVRSVSQVRKHDFLLRVDNVMDSYCTDSNCNGSYCREPGCNLISRANFRLHDSSGNLLLHENLADEFKWVKPGSVKALNAFTGLTLFITAPLTVPLAVNLEGEALKQQVAESNERVAARIANAIAVTFGSRPVDRGKSPLGAGSAIRINSPLDNLLDGVVVVKTQNGFGSGFLVSSNGFIVTNAHVVGDDKAVTIQFRDGRTIAGVVVDRDLNADLALVKSDLQGAAKLTLGKLADSGTGTGVISIGTPKGLEWSVSRGIVSAVRDRDGVILLQTDAAINAGNSGGPLINTDLNEVIGVVTFTLKDASVEGLNFAVSAGQILKSFPYLKLD